MEPEFVSSEERAHWYRNLDVIFPLLLAILGVLFFSDLLFTSKNFYFRDVLNFHYPLRKVMIDSWAHGKLPLWNPFVYLGQPMLANPNYMALYPTNLLNLVLPFNYVFKLHMILHVLLAGTGIYFMQRRLGIAALAAFGGALVYQFSGAVLSFLNLFSITQSVALIPWIGWAFLGCLKRATANRIFIFGCLCALQVITMEPMMLQCILLLLGAFSLLHLIESRWNRNSVGVLLKTVVGGGLISIGLAAIQLLPSLELVSWSNRSMGYSFAQTTFWSLRPATLLSMIVPNLYGNPYTMRVESYWGECYNYGREGYLVSIFLGVGSSLLILLSFWSLRRLLHCIITGTALMTGLLAIGANSPVYSWLFRLAPLFRLGRYPSKYFLLATLLLTMLVSLGLEVTLRPNDKSVDHLKRQGLFYTGILGFLVAILFLGVAFWGHQNPHFLSEWLRWKIGPELSVHKDIAEITRQLIVSFRWAGLFSLILSGTLLLSINKLRSNHVCSLLILVIGAEILPQSLRLNPMISNADIDYVSEVNLFLAAYNAGGPFRVQQLDSPSRSYIRMLRAPNKASAWLSLFGRRSGQFFYGIVNGIQQSVYPSVDDLNTRDSNEIYYAMLKTDAESGLAMLGKLNSPLAVTFGSIDNPAAEKIRSFDTNADLRVNVYKVKDVLPRAYFASNALYVPSHEKALEMLSNPKIPLQNAVILEDGAASKQIKGEGKGTVRFLSYHNTYVSCSLDASVPGFLVLLDSYYPGWKAFVDGRPAGILRANYAFRAVQVPAGKHKLDFVYRPWSFYAGFWIAVLTLVCSALAVCITKPIGLRL